MARESTCPVTLPPDKTDGRFVVTFKALPEAITQGKTVEDALAEAADALEEAIAGRIQRGDPIPEPSKEASLPLVPVPAQTAAKAALYLTLRETGITKSELAARLDCEEKEVRRLLAPRHSRK